MCSFRNYTHSLSLTAASVSSPVPRFSLQPPHVFSAPVCFPASVKFTFPQNSKLWSSAILFFGRSNVVWNQNRISCESRDTLVKCQISRSPDMRCDTGKSNLRRYLYVGAKVVWDGRSFHSLAPFICVTVIRLQNWEHKRPVFPALPLISFLFFPSSFLTVDSLEFYASKLQFILLKSWNVWWLTCGQQSLRTSGFSVKPMISVPYVWYWQSLSVICVKATAAEVKGDNGATVMQIVVGCKVMKARQLSKYVLLRRRLTDWG